MAHRQRGRSGAAAGRSPGAMDTVRDKAKFNTTTSAIAGVIENLRSQIASLDREIRADEAGVKEYEEELLRLRKQEEDVARRVQANEQFATRFDADIGPFEAKYGNLTGEIAGLFSNATDVHTHALELLQQHFSYHPAFLRPGDDFRAVPYVPRPAGGV